MSMQPITVNARDGYALSARVYEPSQAPTRVVFVASAMGVQQRFYEAFATWLTQQGMAVMTFDARGIGASAPTSLRGFKASAKDWATLDMPAAVDAFFQRWPGVPATYLAHSMGGQLFGWLDNTERFERALTVAAGTGYWRLNAPKVRWQAPFLWWVLAPISIAVAGYFPGKRLGVIDDVPADAMMQWRRWCLNPDYLSIEGPAVLARYAQVRTPVTAVVMDDDELISPAAVYDLFRLYPNVPVRFETPQAKHFGMKRIGHFGFFKPSSTGTNALWPASLQWLST